MPIGVVTFFARGYIVNFIKNGGNALIAGLLGALVLSILFRTIYHIAARTFYAQQDTKTPLYISLFTITLNIILALVFTNIFHWGVYGLAWAQSLVSVVEVVVLFSILSHRTPGLFTRQFASAVTRMLLAGVITGVVTYGMLQLFQLQNNDQSFIATFPKFLAITIVSFGTYVLLSRQFRLVEASPILQKINDLLFGRRH